MKGIIFNLAEEVVRNSHGEDAWDAVLDGAGLDGSWTSLGSYPDKDLAKVVGSAARWLGLSVEATLRVIGEGAVPLLAQRYPQFFRPHATTSSFVLTLNDVIHPEVRKLYPGATPPTFGFASLGQNDLSLSYSSARQLCALAVGFLHGAASHYGQSVVITQPSCGLRGDARCLIHCQFADVRL